jgi:hypothetical protein
MAFWYIAEKHAVKSKQESGVSGRKPGDISRIYFPNNHMSARLQMAFSEDRGL